MKFKQPKALLGTLLFASLALLFGVAEQSWLTYACSRGGNCINFGPVILSENPGTRYFTVGFFSFAAVIFAVLAFSEPKQPAEPSESDSVAKN